MPCKQDKDLSKCIGRGKLYIANTRFFWALYLWADFESLNAAIEKDGDKGEALAFCAHMPYWLRVNSDGTDGERTTPKLGELHFLKDKWSLEVVTHECRHTEITAHRVLGIVPYSIERGQDIEQEERACDYLGKLTDCVYCWLWEANPPLRNSD
jgi:hypothetical protein